MDSTAQVDQTATQDSTPPHDNWREFAPDWPASMSMEHFWRLNLAAVHSDAIYFDWKDPTTSRTAPYVRTNVRELLGLARDLIESDEKAAAAPRAPMAYADLRREAERLRVVNAELRDDGLEKDAEIEGLRAEVERLRNPMLGQWSASAREKLGLPTDDQFLLPTYRDPNDPMRVGVKSSDMPPEFASQHGGGTFGDRTEFAKGGIIANTFAGMPSDADQSFVPERKRSKPTIFHPGKAIRRIPLELDQCSQPSSWLHGISLEPGAVLLRVGAVLGKPYLWAVVDARAEHEPMQHRILEIVDESRVAAVRLVSQPDPATPMLGKKNPGADGYLGAVELDGGERVVHVFEREGVAAAMRKGWDELLEKQKEDGDAALTKRLADVETALALNYTDDLGDAYTLAVRDAVLRVQRRARKNLQGEFLGLKAKLVDPNAAPLTPAQLDQATAAVDAPEPAPPTKDQVIQYLEAHEWAKALDPLD